MAQYSAKQLVWYRQVFSLRNVVLGILFLSAFGVRLQGLDSRPFDFHPVKQFRSSLTARAIYYESGASEAEDWQREVSGESLRQIETLVPPIIDRCAAIAHRLLGGESLAAARFLSVLFWMIGGIYLYRIALQIMGADAAIASVAFYLLLPYGVIASQSFQPDPMMILSLLIGVHALLRYDSRPTIARFCVAAAVSSLSVLIKPVGLPVLFLAFVALAIRRSGIAAGFLGRPTIIFGAVILGPSLAYYGYHIFVSADALQTQAEKSLVLSHFLDFRFWDGWLKRIRIVMGFTFFVAGLFGALMQPSARGRALVPGLWAGYLLMCLLFNYTISTHDYYHLPLIPIVALSLGALITPALDALRSVLARPKQRIAALGLMALALFLSVGTSYQARSRVPGYEGRVALAADIGETVGHSTRTIHLAPFQGFPLMYYGELSGRYWPYWYDIRDEQLWMNSAPSARERLEGLMAGFPADFFIIADLEEFERQTDLRDFLVSSYPVMVQKDSFLVFDLRSIATGPR